MSRSSEDPAPLWAYLIIEELVRHAITHFVISPGSRSTPLVAAIARHPKTISTIHFDERGAAFFALGYARATGTPAVLVCTSGTAVANYFPAVVEASSDDVPLLMLTADRPSEMRDTGANQTIKQTSMFGEYLCWSFDIPVPDEKIDPAFVLTTVDQAIQRAISLPTGPVQLNCQFREPFTLVSEIPPVPEQLESWSTNGAPYTEYLTSTKHLDSEHAKKLADLLNAAKRGLLVVGRLASEADRVAARSLAEKLGWPVLCDVTSGLSLRKLPHTRIEYAPIVAKLGLFKEEYVPDLILHLGGPFVSKSVQEMIAAHKGIYVQVSSSSKRIDPAHRVSHRVVASVADFCQGISALVRTDPNRSETLQKDSHAIAERLKRDVDSRNDCTDIGVARAITEQLPEQSALFLASSMPIRLFDSYCSSDHANLLVAANRGASGIDGTIASAVGFARGTKRLTTLVIGDLSFLHDLNSLALVKELETAFVIVVLNDNGGGIFWHLPVAREKDLFETYFATPHGLSFSKAAGQFEIDYDLCNTMAHFRSAYAKAVSHPGKRIIEVTLNREENVRLHQSLLTTLSTK